MECYLPDLAGASRPVAAGGGGDREVGPAGETGRVRLGAGPAGGGGERGVGPAGGTGRVRLRAGPVTGNFSFSLFLVSDCAGRLDGGQGPLVCVGGGGGE